MKAITNPYVCGVTIARHGMMAAIGGGESNLCRLGTIDRLGSRAHLPAKLGRGG